jgi:transposase
MDSRERNGLAMALWPAVRITDSNGLWTVPSQTHIGMTYKVFYGTNCSCTCEDFRRHDGWCKHIWATHYRLMKDNGEDLPDLDDLPPPRPRKQKRNWRAYRRAREEQKPEFQILLRDLCAPLTTPLPTAFGGRPRLPLSDVIFALVYKVYSLFPTDRFMSDLRRAKQDGLVSQVATRNSIINYMADKDLTPVLKKLIVESSAPLRALERGHFVQDGTGITTGRYRRWLHERDATAVEKRDWIKLTLICGVQTQMVAAVEVMHGDANDANYYPKMIGEVAKHNRVVRVSADGLFCTVDNFTATEEIGATLYSPMPVDASPVKGGIWAKMYHLYHLRHAEFMKQYHKQALAESTFSAIKRNWGEAVRSRTDDAMKNEVLCKVLCHNICLVIESMFELGIEAAFWQEQV